MVYVKFSMFFDSKKVVNAVDKATRAVLSKAGSFIRQTAIGSIRTRKKSAHPGNPPHSHNGWFKRLIFFGYDATNQSVVVGPQLLNGGKGNPTVPEVLERGGVRKGQSYHAFPYMGPALDANQEKFAGLFAGAVKG